MTTGITRTAPAWGAVAKTATTLTLVGALLAGCQTAGQKLPSGPGWAPSAARRSDAANRRRRAGRRPGRRRHRCAGGGAVGNYMDRQEQALRQELQGSGVDVHAPGRRDRAQHARANITFATDSAQISPQFYPTLNQIGKTLRNYPQTTVQVVGHTDSTGAEQYNIDLSLRRASSVAQVPPGAGLPAAADRRVRRRRKPRPIREQRPPLPGDRTEPADVENPISGPIPVTDCRLGRYGAAPPNEAAPFSGFERLDLLGVPARIVRMRRSWPRDGTGRCGRRRVIYRRESRLAILFFPRFWGKLFSTVSFTPLAAPQPLRAPAVDGPRTHHATDDVPAPAPNHGRRRTGSSWPNWNLYFFFFFFFVFSFFLDFYLIFFLYF